MPNVSDMLIRVVRACSFGREPNDPVQHFVTVVISGSERVLQRIDDCSLRHTIEEWDEADPDMVFQIKDRDHRRRSGRVVRLGVGRRFTDLGHAGRMRLPDVDAE